MHNVLLTGSTGFVGREVSKRLASTSDFELVLAGRELTVHLPVNVPFHELGQLDSSTDWSQALLARDVVIHSAARVHVMHDTSTDPLAEFRRVNVEGTLNLARQAAAAGVKRFIFISSIKVNGEGTTLGKPYTAFDTPAPQDPYGVSKLEADLCPT